MPVEGFVEYRRREYCRDIQCPVQVIMDSKGEGSEDFEKLRAICKEACLHTTHEFHKWLIDRGYLVVKPKPEGKEEE
jgi:hypothetical protein